MVQGIDFGPDHKVRLPARFNVAVPFIDRHMTEARGAKAAIRTVHGETVTYAELAERVNRAGNALLAQGLKPGDRVLMVVKDCPDFFYVFWGAIKAGIVPIPLNTMLRAADYAYIIEDSGCGLVVYSTEFAAEVEPALKQVARKARKEHYPAPYALIATWQRSGGGMQSLLKAEARSVAKLAKTETARNLIRVFFLQERLKGLGGKEGIDHCSLAFEIGRLRRFRSPHAAACATRELPCCRLRTLHDRRNLVERHREDVVQHEGEPLGGR